MQCLLCSLSWKRKRRYMERCLMAQSCLQANSSNCSSASNTWLKLWLRKNISISLILYMLYSIWSLGNKALLIVVKGKISKQCKDVLLLLMLRRVAWPKSHTLCSKFTLLIKKLDFRDTTYSLRCPGVKTSVSIQSLYCMQCTWCPTSFALDSSCNFRETECP